jgi:hypothetical protein
MSSPYCSATTRCDSLAIGGIRSAEDSYFVATKAAVDLAGRYIPDNGITDEEL